MTNRANSYLSTLLTITAVFLLLIPIFTGAPIGAAKGPIGISIETEGLFHLLGATICLIFAIKLRR